MYHTAPHIDRKNQIVDILQIIKNEKLENITWS